MLSVARFLLVLGLVIMISGCVLYLLVRFNSGLERLPIGRLPGDFYLKIGNITCFFPLVTSLILSIGLTILLNLVLRILRR